MKPDKPKKSDPLSFDEIIRRAMTIKPDKPKKESRPKANVKKPK